MGHGACRGVHFPDGTCSVLQIGAFKKYTVVDDGRTGPYITWGCYTQWCVATSSPPRVCSEHDMTGGCMCATLKADVCAVLPAARTAAHSRAWLSGCGRHDKRHFTHAASHAQRDIPVWLRKARRSTTALHCTSAAAVEATYLPRPPGLPCHFCCAGGTGRPAVQCALRRSVPHEFGNDGHARATCSAAPPTDIMIVQH